MNRRDVLTNVLAFFTGFVIGFMVSVFTVQFFIRVQR